jgi:hypothetical protein
MKRNELGQFISLGVGTSRDRPPISVKFPVEIDNILRQIPDRSDYIRKAVIEKLIEDGYLKVDKPIIE